MPSELYKELASRSERWEETNDCTVKAWAVVAGLSYEDAHDDLKSRGRRFRRGVHMRSLLGTLLRMRNLGAVDVTVKWRKKGVKTVTTAANLDPKGSFLVFVRQHVLAVKGGEIHDWTEGRRHRVNQIFQIVNN